jgi:hypothetical protein
MARLLANIDGEIFKDHKANFVGCLPKLYLICI